MPFRGDLEGLRGVAVALVVLYHAGIPAIAGGYVGVDVFFVLSGFLITGLIVGELEATGTISLVAFYARRARRLLPAAMLVLATTLILSALVLPPLRIGDVAGDAVAVALYVSNVRFAMQATDYLQAHRDPSPLLHFWSLGVEEQFYVLWPALLLLAWRLRRSGSLTVAVALVGATSFAASVLATGFSAPVAFFSLPTRAWELALGALLALARGRLTRMPGPFAFGAGALGLALIAAAAVELDAHTSFPGWAALLPTVGAALVIAAGARQRSAGPSSALALAPLRWLGRISYSLYLWHWPVIVIPAAAIGSDLSVVQRTALVVLAVPLAALTYLAVEEPIRRGRIVGSRPGRSLLMASGSMTALVVVAITTGSWNAARLTDTSGRPTLGEAGSEVGGTTDLARGQASLAAVPADLVPRLTDARADVAVTYTDGCHVAVLSLRSLPCTYGDASSRTTVVLFGDSHGAQWFPALDQLAHLDRWKLVSLTKAGCPSFEVTVWNDGVGRAYDECDVWRLSALERIARERPRVVVVANSDVHELAIDGAPVKAADVPHEWADGVRKLVDRLLPMTELVLIIEDTPRSRSDVPACLSAHLTDADACATPRAQAFAKRISVRVEAGPGVRTIDPALWVCPLDPCPPIVGRTLVYSDVHHLTATYVRGLAPLLRGHLGIGGSGP